MTAYSSRYQLAQGPVFSYASNSTYSFEEPIHKARPEEPRCVPGQYTPQITPSSPDGSPDYSHYPDNSSCRIRDERDDSYGLHYYYGKLWDSASLGEHEKTRSVWTTTSSSDWITPTHRALQDQPSGTQSEGPHYNPPNQNVRIFDDHDFSHGRVYPASRTTRAVETAFDRTSRMSLSEESNSLPFGFPLYRRPPSPRTIRSFKVDTSLIAHQRIPPEKISTYSELSPNIEYMERLKLEEAYSPIRSAAPAPPQPSITITQNQGSVVDVPPAASSGTRVDTSTGTIPLPSGSTSTPPISSTPPEPSLATPPKKRRRRRNTVEEPTPAKDVAVSSSTSPEETRSPTTEVKYIKPEARKPSLACTFCRERKISCGRPPAGSADPTCNQCARRSFKCTYLNELSAPKPSTSRRRS